MSDELRETAGRTVDARAQQRIDRAHIDGLVIDALQNTGAFVRRASVGPFLGSFYGYDADGDTSGKRCRTWREAALDALRYEGGAYSALADRIEHDWKEYAAASWDSGATIPGGA